MKKFGTPSINTTTLLQKALEAAERACSEILNVYTSGDFQTEAKGDNSPLTVADRPFEFLTAKALRRKGLS